MTDRVYGTGRKMANSLYFYKKITPWLKFIKLGL